jgi:hypothetical protein
VIVFLTGSSRNELHGSRDNFALATIKHQKVDVIGSGDVAQDAQAIALFLPRIAITPISDGLCQT